ncbi:ribosome biogenesis protein WDR12 homolog [Euphorbia lathyris]|uniref:ribosome biogenesis protein WDR12 homolog n=1 Tax=Euphorbia lathyris TaxID=212925 RepID=UPI0033135179
MEGDTEERQVQARFITKLKPPFKAPTTSITIPANLTRLGLSTIVNSLLKAGDPDWENHPFDFLIDGELIRMSLEQFLLVKGISAEKILEIEYLKAVVPRKEEEPSLHDDWVSAVDGSCTRFILTGCCDGFGRVWKAAGVCTHILEGHDDAITSVSVINPGGVNTMTLATASKDQTLRLWKFDEEESKDNPTTVRAFKVLRGHNASVQSVAADTSGNMICSGSLDCTINLWRTNELDTEGDLVSVKKRKVKNAVQESLLEGEAFSTLAGHTQRVSSVVWPEHGTIYSASWDNSVRSWDVETGKDSSKIFCGKALNCVHVGGEGSALIAAGGSDPVLRIWDPRKPGSSAPIYQFSSHSSWISACKWHDKSWFHLLSASYDGKVMLWDLRTAWPVSVIETHEEKVLSADWWKGDTVISGGADSKLCISSDISVA